MKSERKDRHDPISREPGAHPVGVAVGTAGGAAAGGVLGALGAAAAAGGTMAGAAGPLGMVVGAIAGGIAGAFAGKAVAEHVSPTREGGQVLPDVNADDYRRAYKFGKESHAMYPAGPFQDIERSLRRTWEPSHANQPWDIARSAARDGWEGTDANSAEVGPGNSRIE